jgi:hypothetical protein
MAKKLGCEFLDPKNLLEQFFHLKIPKKHIKKEHLNKTIFNIETSLNGSENQNYTE